MRVAALISVFVLVTVGESVAACLLDDYSVEAEFRRSELVALASVVSERSVAADPQAGLLDGVLYTLHIEELFRGGQRRTVNVFSENSSGRFPMQKGTTYIVLLYQQGGRLSADYCGNSGVASEKRAVIAKVRELAKRR